MYTACSCCIPITGTWCDGYVLQPYLSVSSLTISHLLQRWANRTGGGTCWYKEDAHTLINRHNDMLSTSHRTLRIVRINPTFINQCLNNIFMAIHGCIVDRLKTSLSSDSFTMDINITKVTITSTFIMYYTSADELGSTENSPTSTLTASFWPFWHAQCKGWRLRYSGVKNNDSVATCTVTLISVLSVSLQKGQQ